jgi:hypothetical protein
MSYFNAKDHNNLTYDDFQVRCQDTQAKFLELHSLMHDKMRLQAWDLHPHGQKSRIVSDVSAAATSETQNVLVLSYFRSLAQAQLVEKLMGMDQGDVEAYRHPVIELRMAPDYFALELIVSPYAWWDQQNFIGKMGLERHRQQLRNMLYNFESSYRFGFWGGEAPSDMYLTSWQVLQGHVLNDWINTFADGQDWLRFGAWYEPDSDALSEERIVQELSSRIGELYAIYDFLLWSSNNNYQEFYKRQNKPSRRLYA